MTDSVVSTMSTDSMQDCCYTFKGHSNFWGEAISNLKDKQCLKDIKLRSSDHKTFRAHKVVIGLCSPVLMKLITTIPRSQYLNGAKPMINMKHTTGVCVEKMLEFMYHRRTTVDKKDLNEFLKCVESLRVVGLADSANLPNDQVAILPNDPVVPKHVSEIAEHVSTVNTEQQSATGTNRGEPSSTFRNHSQLKRVHGGEINCSSATKLKVLENINEDVEMSTDGMEEEDWQPSDLDEDDSDDVDIEVDKDGARLKKISKTKRMPIKKKGDAYDVLDEFKAKELFHDTVEDKGLFNKLMEDLYKRFFAKPPHCLESDKGVRYHCRFCGFEAKMKVNITSHIESNHLQGISHECLICECSFKTTATLKSHMKRQHTEVYEYQQKGKRRFVAKRRDLASYRGVQAMLTDDIGPRKRNIIQDVVQQEHSQIMRPENPPRSEIAIRRQPKIRFNSEVDTYNIEDLDKDYSVGLTDHPNEMPDQGDEFILTGNESSTVNKGGGESGMLARLDGLTEKKITHTEDEDGLVKNQAVIGNEMISQREGIQIDENGPIFFMGDTECFDIPEDMSISDSCTRPPIAEEKGHENYVARGMMKHLDTEVDELSEENQEIASRMNPRKEKTDRPISVGSDSSWMQIIHEGNTVDASNHEKDVKNEVNNKKRIENERISQGSELEEDEHLTGEDIADLRQFCEDNPQMSVISKANNFGEPGLFRREATSQSPLVKNVTETLTEELKYKVSAGTRKKKPKQKIFTEK